MEEAEKLAVVQCCVVLTSEKGFRAMGGVALQHIHRDPIRITRSVDCVLKLRR